MKIAVTGATGHLGVNLVPGLLEAGYEVRVMVHKTNTFYRDKPVEIFHGDILDPLTVNKFAAGADVLIHMAAKISIMKNSPESLKVNIDGTRNILDAALDSGVQRLIHFSSIHSLKSIPLDAPLDESRELNLDSKFDYDRSKAESERLAMKAAEEGIGVTVLNPTAVIGPNDFRPSFLGRAIIGFAKGSIPALVAGGYDWVDVRDVVGATITILKSGSTNKKYMLSGHWRNIKELGQAVHRAGGAKPPRLTVPYSIALAGAGILNIISGDKGDEKLFTPVSLESLHNGHRNISHARASQDLGYNPRPFEDTISDTVSWFRENKYL
jgi:dihydroflavonol-4-reductase